MKIESLELLNFCQHARRSIVFGDGLTAIIGSNGSGKSNVLGAARFAFTGENPNAGRLDANIYDMASATEASYVRMTFSHGPVRATVQRNLRPSTPTAELEVHTTGERIEGARDVNARISQILSISNEVLNEMVIVAQTDIFGFLDRTPAKRAEAFQKLFHTEKAGMVYKIIGEHLKTVEIPSVATNLDELRRNIALAIQQQRDFSQQLQNMASFADIQRNRDHNSDVLRNFQRMQQLEGRLQAHRMQLAARQGDLAAVTAQVTAITANMQIVQAVKDDNAAAAGEAARILANLEEWQRQDQRRAVLLAKIEEAAEKLADLQESAPVPPDTYAVEDMRQLQEELNDSLHKKAADERLLASLAGDVAECPTCGTSVATLQPVIEQAKARVPVLAEKIREGQEKIAVRGAYEQARRAHNEQLRHLEATLAQNREFLSQVPASAHAEQDVSVLEAAVTRQRTFDDGLAEYNFSLQQANLQIARIEGGITQIAQVIAETVRELETVPRHTAAQAAAAQRNLGVWEQAAESRRTVEQQLAVAENTRQQNELLLQQTAAMAARAAVLKSWSQLATSWRDLVHKDAAPRFVSQQNLARLQSGINEALEMFQTEYRVAADEGLSFVAHFSRGSRQPAERLSEGQKVILALAFRIALNSMFADNIGALYLDEPTAYLDEHHIRGFEPVLHRLKEFSTSRGLQVIIITHERGLAPLFDAVVEL